MAVSASRIARDLYRRRLSLRPAGRLYDVIGPGGQTLHEGLARPQVAGWLRRHRMEWPEVRGNPPEDDDPPPELDQLMRVPEML